MNPPTPPQADPTRPSSRITHHSSLLAWWAALGALLALATMIDSEGPLPIDTTVREWARASPLKAVAGFWRVISWPGEHGWSMLAIVSITSFCLWITGHRRAAWVSPVLVFGAAGANVLLKGMLGRVRPSPNHDVTFPADHYSFPSGHAVQYVCLFGFLAWWGWRHGGGRCGRIALMGLGIAMVALVGPSRLFLDLHWFSDVLAGYLFGYLWLALGLRVAFPHGAT